MIRIVVPGVFPPCATADQGTPRPNILLIQADGTDGLQQVAWEVMGWGR